MPVHKIPRATLHEDLVVLEREGERIRSVAIDGEYAIVVTEFITLETRVVS
jgi:hypothetical protein